jgi:hypothetical protein
MRVAVWSVAGLLLVSCSPNAPQPEVPAGWKSVGIPSCCTVAIPSDATLKAGKDPVDDPVFLLRGPGYEGMFTVTGRGSALPIASDGRPAGVASYRVADPNYPERRSLLWTFAGRNDGSGKNLVLDLSCKETGCAVFLPMIGSLDAKP